MTDVYKICYVDNNIVQKIYVFIGSRVIPNKEVDLTSLYTKDPTNTIFSNIFSVEEKKDIIEAEIIFFPMEIHLDDTIETIKKKYIIAAKEESPTYSGLYLYTKTEQKLDPYKVFQLLTHNGDIELTRDILIQYLLNIDDVNIDSLPVKDVYDYDDMILVNLKVNDKWAMSIPFGQTIQVGNEPYIYPINPFNVLEYDDYLTTHVSDILVTTNHNLLMEYPDMHRNTIYACHAQDVLSYADNSDLSQESTISIYYPYLKAAEISSLGQYMSSLEQLKVETDNLVNDVVWYKNIQNVDILYDVNHSKTGEPILMANGVKKIRITLSPDYAYKLPLDVVFKLVHATQKTPLIKFNPTKRQENIYRIYTDRVAINGKKIPYLSKGIIFKYMKLMANSKEVAIYIQPEDLPSPIILSFYDNGNIEAFLDMPDIMSVEQIDVLLTRECNPIIDIVAQYLQQSGYTMKLFESIRNGDIEISDVEYIIKSKLSKKLKLSSLNKCISSIFNIISDDSANGIIMRFKKVANYNEMDSQEAYIVESLNAGARDLDIMKGLVENFHIRTEEEARTKLVEFISRQQVVQQAFKNKRIKIKNNPGFLTHMTMEKFEANIITTVFGINAIGYLDTIPKYITSIMIISQTPTASLVPLERINTLCKGKSLALDTIIKEDISAKPVLAKVTAIGFNTLQEDAPVADMQQDLLAMLMDDDEDSDEDSDEESDEEGITGGAPSPEEITKDITGLSLSNPNPFSERLKSREPTLFLTNPSPGYNSYSRSCPSSTRRQPVILTQEEKDKIDKEHPGSYEHSISYQSTKGGPSYHYICPRYWSLKEGVSLTPEEAASGKYGDIIPKKTKNNVVPPNGGVYEFDSSYYRNDVGKYEGAHPGFMKPSKHQDGKCMPCCFKAWDTPAHISLRNKCDVSKPKGDKPVASLTNGSVTEDKLPISDPDDKEEASIKKPGYNHERFDEYVKGPEKFPLELGRIGYLPINIQRFLHTDNKKCQISSHNTNIKLNTTCLVRLGVERSINQSFISTIAYIYADTLPSKKVPTIKEMKEVLLQALDIDIFISIQNGSLSTIFYKDESLDIDIEQHNRSIIYKNTNMSNIDEVKGLKKIAVAFNNYKSFILDPTIIIGYEYLWDLICFNNPKLFTKGLNLVVLEALEDDMTGNVSVICPTNHYSSAFFDINKKVAILIKKDGLFEPIISYEDQGKRYVINRRFSLKYKDMLPNLKAVIDSIRRSMTDKCIPLPSRPNVYKFATNLPLSRVIYLLKLKKYVISNQIINNNAKVIGVEVTKGDLRGMVPCFPSSPDLSIEGYTRIDDYLGNSYSDTKQFLTKINKDTNGKLPILPSIKVIDDDLIVGIITQSNQFVPINPPIQDVYGDDLKTVTDMDYINVNNISMINKSTDKKRLKYMKRIKLETGFYNTFRNMVRMMLGQYKYNSIRQEIEQLVSNVKLSYLTKIRQVDAKIHLLVNGLISFTKLDKSIISSIHTVTNCNTLSKDKCNEKLNCVATDGNCVLLLPKINLINDVDNEAMYFGKISDEIVRYSRIRSFIFEPKSFLSFTVLKYNLSEDEIILLQSLLTQDYFDELTPRTENKYIKHNAFDTAPPINGQVYDNIIPIVDKKLDQTTCSTPTIARVAGKWDRIFPTNSNELVFSNTPVRCTYDIITTILQVNAKEGNGLTTNEVKDLLSEEYVSLYNENGRGIISALRMEGKAAMVKQLIFGQITLPDLIMSEEYYLTTLDIWIIARLFKIPIVLYSATKFPENNKTILVVYSDLSDNYFFIKVPGIKVEVASNYRLLVNKAKSKISILTLNAETKKEIQSQSTSSDDLLLTFLNAPIKRNLRIVLDDSQDEKKIPKEPNKIPKEPKKIPKKPKKIPKKHKVVV